jgi:nicotinic acid mononucleotide adenylyltransferase
MGGVCLTSAPLFLQKAALFPDSTFIVGADTLNRIFDSKYYNGKLDTDAILNCFREKNVRFMVFRRKSVELCISPEVIEFCEIVPMAEYEDDGISSTEIRRKSGK